SMPPEVAELSLKRLAKENILLGPIHEILFRYSTDQISDAYRHKFGLKKEFAKFKTSMTSSSPGDIAYRQDIASKMHSELIKLVSYFSSFGEFKQLSHVKKLDLLDKYRKYTENKSSIFDYNIKAETLIKNIELLIEINEMPGSKDFFEKVFMNSMEAIYKTCYRRAHGTLETGLEVAKYAVMPGAIALLYHQGVPFAASWIEPSAVLTALGTVGTLIYDANRGANDSAIPTLKSVPKTLWIKASNFFSKTKVANKLKADSGESTISEAAEVIKSSASISDKLDFDFGGIKQELARGIQRDIHIPNWGKEFSIGVSNLMTRLSLIREELVQINEKVDPIFNEIQQAKLNKTTYQREATETLNELYGDKLFALLIDHQAIELDLITLSHALDQYIIGLDKYAKSAEHTPAEQYFINSKSELLRSQLLTLTKFVQPLTGYKQNIITILDTLNMTTASTQMNYVETLSPAQ
ncbi:MAG: hypothetical protein L6Q37_09410, partial [Bdellovibrionaceae bacterium]|nr:hypothetical protein [Pseudobdellovibrionaceae bacterium]